MFLKQKNSGFTLLEMLVVVAIFSMIVLVISSILNSVFNSSKTIMAKERLQSDSNSIIEIISKDIRLYQPNYKFYKEPPLPLTPYDLTGPVDRLVLVNKDGDVITYRKSSGEVNNCGGRSPDVCLVMQTGDDPGNPVELANITPTNVDLVDIKFYIEPAENPFDLDPTGRSNKQPLVTIILKTEADAGRGKKVDNIIQTSISSRFYQQRY